MKKALDLHKKLKGKIEIVSKIKIKTLKDLSLVYTPGVGAVSSHIAANHKLAREYTMKGNTIAVVSDGSAVLGLGNIGPEAALPVMEGKAMLFKQFAKINAVPIVLNTQSVDEIVETVKHIAPGFGGINLEDISAPRCFEIERRLKKELNIPVMHDDQHGTAIVILAGLLNALKVAGKKLKEVKIIISGAGAAGTALVHILRAEGARYIIVVDKGGAIYRHRLGLNEEKVALSEITNPTEERGVLSDVMRSADVFIGVSAPHIVDEAMIKAMNTDPIIFALANPVPEIMPELALRAGARVVATGRSDFPNQLNNALVFPGVFRGALDHKLMHITDAMKLSAAHALAKLVRKPTPTNIIPNIFDTRVVPTIARAVK